MPADPYRRLAAALDAIPNGFPSTPSGVELRLLARLYTPEQAALGAVMRLTPEPSAAIASRAGMDPSAAHRTLKEMARLGLIASGRGQGGLTFSLRPFVVGVYEAQRPRLDREIAELMEAYLRESHHAVMSQTPAVHRVVPVRQAIGAELEVFPYEHAESLVRAMKAWAAGSCICRVQKNLLGEGCGRPVEACLWMAPVEGAFDDAPDARALTLEGALALLGEAAAAGLVPTAMNTQQGIYYICNCCPCCCGILRGLVEGGHAAAVARSAFRAVVDAEVCAACGACVERCHFQALALGADAAEVDAGRCLGCGLCVAACPTGALALQRRPDAEAPAPPMDEAAWRALRARERGLRMADIM